MLTSKGRAECSWALASMELSLNSPPEAPCRRHSLVNIKQRFPYCKGVRPPSGHTKAHLTATLKLYNTPFLLKWYLSHQRSLWKTATLNNFWEIGTRKCEESWPLVKWPSTALFFLIWTGWWTHISFFHFFGSTSPFLSYTFLLELK